MFELYFIWKLKGHQQVIAQVKVYICAMKACFWNFKKKKDRW